VRLDVLKLRVLVGDTILVSKFLLHLELLDLFIQACWFNVSIVLSILDICLFSKIWLQPDGCLRDEIVGIQIIDLDPISYQESLAIT